MKLAFAATMIRPRYFPNSIVAQLVSVSAFSHGLGPEPTLKHDRRTESLQSWNCQLGDQSNELTNSQRYDRSIIPYPFVHIIV